MAHIRIRASSEHSTFDEGQRRRRRPHKPYIITQSITPSLSITLFPTLPMGPPPFFSLLLLLLPILNSLVPYQNSLNILQIIYILIYLLCYSYVHNSFSNSFFNLYKNVIFSSSSFLLLLLFFSSSFFFLLSSFKKERKEKNERKKRKVNEQTG